MIAALRIDWSSSRPVGAAVFAALIAGTVGIALRVYVSFAILRGYNPARIFITVVAPIALLSGLRGGFDLLGWLLVASFAVLIVLLWVPASNRYFKSVTAARKGTLSQQPS